MSDPRIQTYIKENLNKSLESSFDIITWAREDLNTSPYDNQIAILEAVSDPSITHLVVLGSRQGGKSWSVAAGSVRICEKIPGYKWSIWAPKLDQATRLIGVVKETLAKSNIRDKVDWSKTTMSKLMFKNGSGYMAQSGAVTTETEGWTSDGVIIDEAHRLEDSIVKLRIMPQLGTSVSPKIIKLGMPLYKGNFFNSFKSKQYKVVSFNWKDAQIYFRGGSIWVDGKEYPKTIFDMMPYTVKQKYFSTHPELWVQGELTEYEWDTQYEIKWLEDVDLMLKEDDISKVFNGDYSYIERGIPGEVYYAGLDFAGGGLVRGKDPDYTHLSIGRVVRGVKQIVAAYEWQGDLYDQMEEILRIINPKDGLFRVVKIVADYGNQGGPIVDIFKKRHKMPIEGLMYEWKEERSGKNYKNAMFDALWININEDKFKYPKNYNKHPVLMKSYDEWNNLERHSTRSANAIIEAASGHHDDACCADVACGWAMGNNRGVEAVAGENRMSKYFPNTNPSVPHTSSRFNEGGQGSGDSMPEVLKQTMKIRGTD